MANISAILSGISVTLLLGSSLLAYRNTGALEQEIGDRKAAGQRLVSAQDSLAQLREEVSRTQQQTANANEEAKTLGIQAEEQRGKIETMRSDIASKRRAEESLREKVETIRIQVESHGEVQEMVQKIQRLNQEIVSLEDDKQAKEAKRANLLAEKEATTARIARYNDINDRVRRPESYFNSTTISGVYSQWGFVTLAAGSSSGVVAGSTLNVFRDGGIIARLRVRSVESARSAAEVVPDSIAEGEVLMVGDRVVPAVGGASSSAQASN